MPVTITQNIRDIAGVDDNSVVWFSQHGHPRPAEDGVTMISTRRVSAKPVGGVLTVQLEPGPCVVEMGARSYEILVPDVDGPLLPLILNGLPEPPPGGTAWVRNRGSIFAVEDVPLSWHNAHAGSLDPHTLYVVFPDE